MATIKNDKKLSRVRKQRYCHNKCEIRQKDPVATKRTHVSLFYHNTEQRQRRLQERKKKGRPQMIKIFGAGHEKHKLHNKFEINKQNLVAGNSAQRVYNTGQRQNGLEKQEPQLVRW